MTSCELLRAPVPLSMLSRGDRRNAVPTPSIERWTGARVILPSDPGIPTELRHYRNALPRELVNTSLVSQQSLSF